MTGMTSMLSLRGVMPVTMTVASRRALPDFSDERGDAAGHVRGARLASPSGRRIAHVVSAGHEHDDLRIHAVELAVLQAPEHVLRLVRAPAEVRGVPAREVLLPVGEEVLVLRVARAPAARDRVAHEVDVDLAGACAWRAAARARGVEFGIGARRRRRRRARRASRPRPARASQSRRSAASRASTARASPGGCAAIRASARPPSVPGSG